MIRNGSSRYLRLFPPLIGDEGGHSIQRSVETENQNYNLVMHGRPLAEWLIANAGKGRPIKRLFLTSSSDFIVNIDTLIGRWFRGWVPPSSGNWRYFTLSEELAQVSLCFAFCNGIQYTVDKDRRTGFI